MQVSSAFSQLLNLHNLTEEISNAQHERAVRMGEASHNDILMLVGTCIAIAQNFETFASVNRWKLLSVHLHLHTMMNEQHK